MEIAFDPEKAAANPVQHEGVTFAEASAALLDLLTQYADLDFADAKPVAAVPALARLQAAQGGKSRITMRVDTAVIAAFKDRAARTGGNHQTLMNEALRQFVAGQTLADVVRDTIRNELRHG